MTKMTQKAAVFAAISQVLDFEEGTNVGPHMTKELRAQVNLILFEGFRKGTIELEKEYSDSDLKAYVSGLQSNWIRKDTRLNGNTKYVAKNPGSRAGSGDPALKAARALISTLVEGTADYNEVKTFIDSRVSEIAASKAKVTVDFSALPEHLRTKYAK